MIRRLSVFALLAVGVCSCRSGPPIGPGIPVVRSMLETTVTGGSKPFSRPLDVAALPGRGEIAVADAGNNRVEIFDAHGAWLRSFGQRGGGFIRFHELRGIGVDGAGRVLCADAGRAAVLVVDSLLGSAVDEFDFGGSLPAPAPLLSDVAAVGGRVLALDLRRAAVLVGGAAPAASRPGGDSVAGGPSGPALCAAGTDVLWCAEPRSGRVRAFSPAGAPLGGFETRAVRAGAARSPVGVALGSGGRVFVSDAAQGVVAIYDAQGAFLGLLGDEAGRGLSLAGPAGLAFDGAGRLVIVETGARRVQIRRLAVTP